MESVTQPVASNSLSSKATASAVAEKATTMPVISRACGTGVAVHASGGSPVCDGAKKQEYAAADHIEGKNLA